MVGGGEVRVRVKRQASGWPNRSPEDTRKREFKCECEGECGYEHG